LMSKEKFKEAYFKEAYFKRRASWAFSKFLQ
jgi:hypothetical protein